MKCEDQTRQTAIRVDEIFLTWAQALVKCFIPCNIMILIRNLSLAHHSAGKYFLFVLQNYKNVSKITLGHLDKVSSSFPQSHIPPERLSFTPICSCTGSLSLTQTVGLVCGKVPCSNTTRLFFDGQSCNASVIFGMLYAMEVVYFSTSPGCLSLF